MRGFAFAVIWVSLRAMMMSPDMSLIEPNVMGFLLIAGAAFLGAMSKAGFGGALASLSLPLAILVLPPGTALAVLLPVFLLADFYVGWRYRKFAVRRYVIIMVIAATVGQLLGWLLFKQISEAMLILLIGLLAAYTGLRYFAQVLRAPQPVAHSRSQARAVRAVAWKRAGFWCGLSGLASFISLTGGIPAQAYLLAMRLPRVYFVGTMGWFFLSINLAKLPFFIELGLFTPASLTASALLAPLVPLGVWTGQFFLKRISDVWFYHISQACLLIFGAKMVFEVLRGGL